MTNLATLEPAERLLGGIAGTPSVLGWRDLFGPLIIKSTGANRPVWSQIGSSPFWGYKVEVNDFWQNDFHLDHDYAPGTGVYPHVHFFVDAAPAASRFVKWQMEWAFAKGHAQGADSVFPYGSAGASYRDGISTIELPVTTTAFEHHIAELAAPVTDATFETDGLLSIRFTRIASASDPAGNVFVSYADCHYQTSHFATKNRAPNFFT